MVKDKLERIFVVLSKNSLELDIGYLPFNRIPIRSKLWKAIRNKVNYHILFGDGISGIYYDREYAQEHLRIESKWRKREKFKIIELKI